jgi:hypothetical protein
MQRTSSSRTSPAGYYTIVKDFNGSGLQMKHLVLAVEESSWLTSPHTLGQVSFRLGVDKL